MFVKRFLFDVTIGSPSTWYTSIPTIPINHSQIKGRQVTPPRKPMFVYIYRSPLHPLIFCNGFFLPRYLPIAFLIDIFSVDVFTKQLGHELENSYRRYLTTCHPANISTLLESLTAFRRFTPINQNQSP